MSSFGGNAGTCAYEIILIMRIMAEFATLNERKLLHVVKLHRGQAIADDNLPVVGKF